MMTSVSDAIRAIRKLRDRVTDLETTVTQGSPTGKSPSPKQLDTLSKRVKAIESKIDEWELAAGEEED